MRLYVGGPRSKKYHASAACEGLSSTWVANGGQHYGVSLISRQRAIACGLEPCKTCKPAPLLRSAS